MTSAKLESPKSNWEDLKVGDVVEIALIGWNNWKTVRVSEIVNGSVFAKSVDGHGKTYALKTPAYPEGFDWYVDAAYSAWDKMEKRQ